MKKYWMLIFLLSGVATLKCQVLKKDTLERNKNTGTEVVIFEQDKSSSYKAKREKKNVVKTSTLSWVTGYIPVYYEREMTDFMSIQAGAGITTRDFMGDFSRLIYSLNGTPSQWDGNSEYSQYTPDGYDSYKVRKAQLGYCFTVSPKFYPANDGYDGWYIAPEFWLKQYNFKAQQVNVNGTLLKTMFDKEYNRHFDFLVNFGYQALFDVLVLDWHFGVGVRNTWTQQQDIGYSNSNNAYIDATYQYHRLRPLITMELKLGGFF